MTENLISKQLEEIIGRAISEDMNPEDITANAVVDVNRKAEAVWIAKQSGTIAGLDFAKQVFLRLDEGLQWEPRVSDGDAVKAGDLLINFSGSCRAVLSGERIALNISQRMSG